MSRKLDDLRKTYTAGSWTPLNVAVLKELRNYPMINGIIEVPSIRQLTKKVGTTDSTIHRVKKAIELGAIIPTDEELKRAAAKDESIPMRRFYDDHKPRWNGKVHKAIVIKTAKDPQAKEPEPAEPKPPAPVATPEPKPEPEPPAPVAEAAPVPTPEPYIDYLPALVPQLPPQAASAQPPELTEEQIQYAKEKDRMQQEIDDYLKKPLKRPLPEKSTKPPEPVEKVWRKEPEVKESEEPEQEEAEPEEPKDEPKKKKDGRQQIVGPGKDLFQMTRNIRLDFMSLFWYFQNVMDGYEGTIDDFVNWCVKDCAIARGLKLEIVENPLNVATEGMIQYEEKGGGDG